MRSSRNRKILQLQDELRNNSLWRVGWINACKSHDDCNGACERDGWNFRPFGVEFCCIPWVFFWVHSVHWLRGCFVCFQDGMMTVKNRWFLFAINVIFIRNVLFIEKISNFDLTCDIIFLIVQFVYVIENYGRYCHLFANFMAIQCKFYWHYVDAYDWHIQGVL